MDIKEKLLKNKADLEATLVSLRENERIEADDWKTLIEIGDEAHENQEGLAHEEQEKLLEKQIRRVNQALDDLDNNRYGICNKCEGKISEDRLKVRPAAQYCLSCQQSIESA